MRPAGLASASGGAAGVAQRERRGGTGRGYSSSLVAKFKIPKKNSAPAWKFKYRRNKKRIAQFACKSRDESNEPN